MGFLDNIPHEMRQCRQWMLASPDKRPVAVDPATGDTYFGAKDNPDQWMTYESARFWGQELGYRLGFVSRSDDPFTIIDLDNKPDKVYDADAESVKTDMYYNAVGSTYVETSVSGKGIHIVVLGKLAHDFNAKSAGIECYGHKGFVVITGHQVSQSNKLTNQQPVLDWLATKYRNALNDAAVTDSHINWDSVNRPSAAECALDDALIASMSTWQNAANLERYFYGQDLRPDGGGGSEGDLALMQAFLKFTRSEDKLSAAMRMFLKTPRAKLRQPYKSVNSNWDQYIKRTLLAAQSAIARDEQRAKDYDFSAGSHAMLEKYQAQIEAARAQQAPLSPAVAGPANDPAPNSTQAPVSAPGQAAPFTGFSWLTKEDLERLPPIEWAIKGLFPIGGNGAVYGESGAGKSFVVIDMIAAMAEGKPWFGMKTKQLPVSVFALEGEGGLKGRVKAWEVQNQRGYPHGVFFWDSARNGSFALRDGDQRQTINRDRLIQLCADLNANGRQGGVVVIDTLNQASDGADENSSRDMGELLKAMKFIQRETGSLVLIVHHATKSKENQSMRGHGSLYGAMDGVMEVLREVYDAEGQPIPGRRGWIAKKVKDGRDGFERYFEMKEQQVGFDEDGPIMSVAIAPVATEVLDEQTGELMPVEVGSMHKGGSAGGSGRGARGDSAGRKKMAGSREPPIERSTYSGAEHSAGGAGGAAPRSQREADAHNVDSELSRLPFKTAVRDALVRAGAGITPPAIPHDGAPPGRVLIPRKNFVDEIVAVLNPTCEPNDKKLKGKINAAIAYAVDSGKIGKFSSRGTQYFYLLE